MIQRFIRSLLRDVAALCTPQQGGRAPTIHLALQRDDRIYERDTPLAELPVSRQVYVVDAMLVPGVGEHHPSELLLSFCRPLASMQRDPHVEMLGDKVQLSNHAAPRAMNRVQAALTQAIQEGDGTKHSIVVVCIRNRVRACKELDQIQPAHVLSSSD
jgi:hypothetical protein